MTGENVANLIEAIATLIALAGLGVSFWFSWRGQILQRQQAQAAAVSAAESNRQAQAAAQRAAASAALTIDQLTRIADGVESLSRQGAHAAPGAPGGNPAAPSVRPETGAPAETSAPDETAELAAPAWRLTHDHDDVYRLANVGTAEAHDVSVSGSATLDGPRPADGGHDAVGAPSLAAGSSMKFEARILPSTANSAITIGWAAGPGSAERRSWRYPLPAPLPPHV